MLRETARVLADEAHKRVVIVDTSNEIAGDGDVPHPAIGRARRMQVAAPALQHAVMIEAVENHMPEVIIVDEMGTEEEAEAARTIAERGVQLVATAHGNTLENLLANPTLSDLVGGIQTVTLSDEEARRRRTQKSILERKAPPTFDTLIEIQSWHRVAIHWDVAQTVDRTLRGQPIAPEVRWLDESGQVRHSRQTERRRSTRPVRACVAEGGYPRFTALPRTHGGPGPSLRTPAGEAALPATRVYALGVGREHIAQAASEWGKPVQTVDSMEEADIVLTTKARYRNSSGLLRMAEQQAKPVFVLRRNTLAQLRGFLRQLTQTAEEDDREEDGGLMDADEIVTEAERGGTGRGGANPGGQSLSSPAEATERLRTPRSAPDRPAGPAPLQERGP